MIHSARFHFVLTVLTLGLLGSGCPTARSRSGGEAAPPDSGASVAPLLSAEVARVASAVRWHAEALLIADVYPAWGRIDDEARWAPGLCRIPSAAQARFSESDDPTTHGAKLYTLYAKDPQAYAPDLPASAIPLALPRSGRFTRLGRLAQIVVKEAWRPVRVPRGAMDERSLGGGHWGKSRLRPAVRDGVAYGADVRTGLYVMFRLAEGQDHTGTDAGWVYATLVPAGTKRLEGQRGPATRWTVTAAGRIASCMKCHDDADGAGGRLFGLPGRPAPR